MRCNSPGLILIFIDHFYDTIIVFGRFSFCCKLEATIIWEYNNLWITNEKVWGCLRGNRLKPAWAGIVYLLFLAVRRICCSWSWATKYLWDLILRWAAFMATESRFSNANRGGVNTAVSERACLFVCFLSQEEICYEWYTTIAYQIP